MNWKTECAAVLPCFNEAGRIGPVVEAVRRHLPNVFVVDDGSTDDTAKEALMAGATVIQHSANRGKGFALRRGWRHAHQGGFAWALSLDGDGQHAAEDIPEFFACAEKTFAPLVVGNRMDRTGAMPKLRRWTNHWMSRCLSDLTDTPLPDSQCGFRLAHLDTLLRLPLAANRFVIESETIVAFIAAGKRVEFVPVQSLYGMGNSKICPLRDTWRWMRWWTALPPVSG